MGIYNLEHGSIEKHFFVSDDYHGGTNRPRWVEQSFQSVTYVISENQQT